MTLQYMLSSDEEGVALMSFKDSRQHLMNRGETGLTVLNVIVTVLHFVFWCSKRCVSQGHKLINNIFLSNRTSHKNPWATGDVCYPILCGKAHSCTVVCGFQWWLKASFRAAMIV